MPGPVRQLVVRDTLTIGVLSVLFWGSGVAEAGTGDDVYVAGSSVGVSVLSNVSVIVGLIVNVGVIEGVWDGVRVGGGSGVEVKVEMIWKGVFVEVPFNVYFWDV